MDTYLFIWDFHGTLEKNNVFAVQEIVNKTLKHFDVQREISLDESIRLYGLAWVDYFKYMFPSGNDQIWQEMWQQAIAIQTKDRIVEKYIKPNDHAAIVLKAIQDAGHSNLLLSNTSPEHIRFFTRLVNVDEYFDDYIGLDTHSEPREKIDIQEKKAKTIQQYLEGKHFNKVIKIGDRESDIKAGQAVGAITYFFRNIFNTKHHLNIKPDHEISDLRDILKEL
ncbi:HAD family hydrolase [Patescibacteria group bacterium]|nr:HAD family hydrolase [Patescibacteria group bacterium]MBU0963950.1 HAD family hydrolase [Patescibacteria group bacterium]